MAKAHGVILDTEGKQQTDHPPSLGFRITTYDASVKAEVPRAIKQAIDVMRIVERLGVIRGEVASHKSAPRLSPTLTSLVGSPVYVQPGLEEFSWGIKGNAAFGHFGRLVSEQLAKIEDLAKCGETDSDAAAELLVMKSSFLQHHGIVKPNGLSAKVDRLDLAMWEATKICMVAPSSGSFAAGFSGIIKLLQGYTVCIGGGVHPEYSFSFLSKEQVHMLAMLPANGLGLIDPQKLENITKQARELGVEVKSWEDKRDDQALYEALLRGGWLCATNLQSSLEVAQRMARILRDKGFEQISQCNKAMQRHGIRITKSEDGQPLLIEVADHMTASVPGLSLLSLMTLETLLSQGVTSAVVNNQAAAGATLAATALVAAAIANPNLLGEETIKALETYFPKIAEFMRQRLQSERTEEAPFQVKGTFDTRNHNFVPQVGLTNVDELFPLNDRKNLATNGLWSTTGSAAAAGLLKMTSELPTPVFKMDGSRMMPCHPVMMGLAQVVLFAAALKDNESDIALARYPEPAGAAGFGSWLHQKVITEKSMTARDLAHFFRSNGVTLEILDQLLSLEGMKTQSEEHNGMLGEFWKEFLQSMSPTVLLESIVPSRFRISASSQSASFVDRVSGASAAPARDVVGGSVLVFNITGCNGTDRQQALGPRIAEERYKIEQDKSQRNACAL